VRLIELQVAQGRQFALLALGNATREVHEPVPRGHLLDRTGTPLATDRPALEVVLVRPDEDVLRRHLARIAAVLGLEVAEVKALVSQGTALPFPPVTLATDVDPATATRVAEDKLGLPELELRVVPVRAYPLGPAAAHALGYLTEVGPTDVAGYPGLYAPGDRRGAIGAEAALDWVLRGRPGRTLYLVDAVGRARAVLVKETGSPGRDVRLTLDARLQLVAFESLDRALTVARLTSRGRSAATGGAVVALDPRSGAVLALVSLPSFDPGSSEAPTPGGRDAPGAGGPGASPFLNRATAGLYAPGSVFKLVTAVAALEEGVVGPDEVMTDRGRLALGNKRCWLAGGHGRVTLADALAWSCNVYFYELGLRLGPDRLAEWARRLGLGAPPGLDLYRPRGAVGPGQTGPAPGPGLPEPATGAGGADDWGEPHGDVPTPEWKARTFPAEPDFWPAEVMDLAIGQGFHAYTPMEVAVMVSTLANGGTRWRPYLIDAVLDGDGQVIERPAPEPAGRVDVSPANLAVVRQGLVRATMDDGREGRFPGTAASVFGPDFGRRWGVDVAGKTGTAEHGPGSGLADDAWFAGWVPAEDPGLVVVVMVEQGGSGAATAAPVARAVMEAWLASGPGRGALPDGVLLLGPDEGQPLPAERAGLGEVGRGVETGQSLHRDLGSQPQGLGGPTVGPVHDETDADDSGSGGADRRRRP